MSQLGYYGLRAAGMGIYLTLIISSAAPAAVAVYRLVRERRVDGLAVYMITMMVLSTAVSLISGSPRFLLAKEAWLTGATGAWFIGSAWTGRPLAYLYSRPMLERRHPGNGVSWDRLWAELPRFRRIWRTSSVLWGIALLFDSGLRALMAYRLPIDDVPGLGTALYVATSVVLIVITNVMYVSTGLYNPRSRLYAPLAGAPAGKTAGAPAEEETAGAPERTEPVSPRRPAPSPAAAACPSATRPASRRAPGAAG